MTDIGEIYFLPRLASSRPRHPTWDRHRAQHGGELEKRDGGRQRRPGAGIPAGAEDGLLPAPALPPSLCLPVPKGACAEQAPDRRGRVLTCRTRGRCRRRHGAQHGRRSASAQRHRAQCAIDGAAFRGGWPHPARCRPMVATVPERFAERVADHSASPTCRTPPSYPKSRSTSSGTPNRTRIRRISGCRRPLFGCTQTQLQKAELVVLNLRYCRRASSSKRNLMIFLWAAGYIGSSVGARLDPARPSGACGPRPGQRRASSRTWIRAGHGQSGRHRTADTRSPRCRRSDQHGQCRPRRGPCEPSSTV